MNRIFKAAVGGLLWLAFSAIAFCDTITFTGQPNNVEYGGQFTATLASDPGQAVYTYCVDFNNDITVGHSYSVNDVDLANLSMVTDDTRFGTTPVSDFTNQTTPTTIGAPQDRYAMAAWLITQYNFTSGVTMQDDEIQNAIWSLLDATGNTFTSNGGVGTYITQAENWIQSLNATQLNAFESTVIIYSSTSIPGTSIPERWGPGTGDQEMIGFVGDPVGTPEPASFVLLGAGLLSVGLLRKRVKA